MDIVGRWIEERCATDKGSKVENSKLYADYEGWAQNEIGFAMSAIAFGREMSDRGFKRVKVDGSRGVRGLRLLNDKPPRPRF
jgi:putative DNA primase/helicase